MSSRPILLVDDNDKLRRLYSDLLETSGYTVMRASDGEQAIDLFHRIGNPQLVILDIMMPYLNGIQTCERLRQLQQGRQSPILFLTAVDRPEILLDCLRAGGDDYLMKTASMPELLKRVEFWTKPSNVEGLEKRREKIIQHLEAKSNISREGGDSLGDQGP